VALGYEMESNTPEQFATFLRADAAQWLRLIKIDRRERRVAPGEKTVFADHGFPATRRNASVLDVPRVHLGNVV
jgi:hypothetical protein